MKMLWSGWKSASMITDSLPLILTGLNSGAGGAVRPDDVPAAVWAGFAASAGLAGAAAAGAAAVAAGFGASVGLATSTGFGASAGLGGAAGADGCWAPHAARTGNAAIASPMRTAERRDRRRPVSPKAAVPESDVPIRILLETTPTVHGRQAAGASRCPAPLRSSPRRMRSSRPSQTATRVRPRRGSSLVPKDESRRTIWLRLGHVRTTTPSSPPAVPDEGLRTSGWRQKQNARLHYRSDSVWCQDFTVGSPPRHRRLPLSARRAAPTPSRAGITSAAKRRIERSTSAAGSPPTSNQPINSLNPRSASRRIWAMQRSGEPYTRRSHHSSSLDSVGGGYASFSPATIRSRLFFK